MCEDVILCQRLDLQNLGELVHSQRFREKHRSEANDEKDLQRCLKKMQDWPEDVVHEARVYYDTEGSRQWSLFISGGGPFKYSSDCTLSEHLKSGKIAWPLHEAFRVSGIAGGCLIAAAFRRKSFNSGSEVAQQVKESPHLLLGLAAASDSYCALGYANVPELADYRIQEYDGKESVVW